ncbi:MAG: WD40/YVTN/BNR-like repeat-containing protein [Steroidobacteraceae bacterium]
MDPGAPFCANAIRRRAESPGFAVLAAALAVAVAWAAEPPPAGPALHAEHARLAAHSLLIALAASGERLVAVGDRGVVVLSDDHGASWAQAADVPTQALLTGVCFFDARYGLAVGHDEVILATDDGGEHWRRTHDAPEAQRPLLDVWCGTHGQAIAVGAYSTYLVSADRGASWSEQRFTPRPAPQAKGAVRGTPGAPPAEETGAAAGGGYHLNRIVGASAAELYIAGEAGHLYRSDDAGAHWQELPSPYAGSFFDILPLSGGALLASGMRGNLYRSENAGESWSRIDTGTVEMLDGAAVLPGGTLAVVGLSGVVLVSRDGGRTFTLEQQTDRSGLSAALAVGSDALAVVGEGGARRVALGGAAGPAPGTVH